MRASSRAHGARGAHEAHEARPGRRRGRARGGALEEPARRAPGAPPASSGAAGSPSRPSAWRPPPPARSPRRRARRCASRTAPRLARPGSRRRPRRAAWSTIATSVASPSRISRAPRAERATATWNPAARSDSTIASCGSGDASEAPPRGRPGSADLRHPETVLPFRHQRQARLPFRHRAPPIRAAIRCLRHPIRLRTVAQRLLSSGNPQAQPGGLSHHAAHAPAGRPVPGRPGGRPREVGGARRAPRHAGERPVPVQPRRPPRVRRGAAPDRLARSSSPSPERGPAMPRLADASAPAASTADVPGADKEALLRGVVELLPLPAPRSAATSSSSAARARGARLDGARERHRHPASAEPLVLRVPAAGGRVCLPRASPSTSAALDGKPGAHARHARLAVHAHAPAPARAPRARRCTTRRSARSSRRARRRASSSPEIERVEAASSRARARRGGDRRVTLLLAALVLLGAGGAAALAASARPRLALARRHARPPRRRRSGLAASLRALAARRRRALRLAWSVPIGAARLGLDPLSALLRDGAVRPRRSPRRSSARATCAPFLGRRSLGAFVCFFDLLLASMAPSFRGARRGPLPRRVGGDDGRARSSSSRSSTSDAAVRRAGLVYLVASHLGRRVPASRSSRMLGRAAGSLRLRRVRRAARRGARRRRRPVRARPRRLRHEGRPRAAPRLAARGAPGGAEPRVGAACRRVMIKTGIYGILRALAFLPAARRRAGGTRSPRSGC